jgi:glycolate oxidase iron-sulfur subunit
LETPQLVIKSRSEVSRLSSTAFLKYISRRALTHPTLFSGLMTAGTAADKLLSPFLPEESGLRLRLALCRQEDAPLPQTSYIDSRNASFCNENDVQKTKSSCSYFTGCLANHLKPEIGRATETLLERVTGANPDVPTSQSCCGMAALAAGNIEEARQLARKNIEAFSDNSLPILTSCGSCYSHLLSYPDLFEDEPKWQDRARNFSARLQEFSCFFHTAIGDDEPDHLSDSESTIRVLYHDPCHLRFKWRIVDEPRKLLAGIPAVELVELPDGPKCCGQGGLFHIIHPDISHKIRDRLMDDFDALDVELVVTSCSGCLLQWQQALAEGNSSCRVIHLALFLEQHIR